MYVLPIMFWTTSFALKGSCCLRKFSQNFSIIRYLVGEICRCEFGAYRVMLSGASDQKLFVYSVMEGSWFPTNAGFQGSINYCGIDLLLVKCPGLNTKALRGYNCLCNSNRIILIREWETNFDFLINSTVFISNKFNYFLTYTKETCLWDSVLADI